MIKSGARNDDKDKMEIIRRYWLYILVTIIATAIPVSALFLEPTAQTAASVSDEQFEKGILRRTDNDGCVWALQKASGPSLLSFRKPGSPITVKTSVRRVNSGMVSLELVLEGRAGETYRPIIKKGNGASRAPWVRIIDRQGAVIEEAQFAYG